MTSTPPRPSSSRLVLERTMASPEPPTWPGAVWVGAVDAHEVPDGDVAIPLADAAGHRTARLLVRAGTSPRGFVDLPVTDGAVDASELRAAVDALPPAEHPPVPVRLPSTTVVLCTRDRADQLADALRSVLALDHPDLEVVVVDNAPSDDATRRLVTAPGTDPRIRYVLEPTPGLSSARNAGVRAARGEVVAFTDDDVVVDRGWLRALASGFARGEDVVCVSGLVASGELRTPAQRWFDERVTWSRNLTPRVFRLTAPPADRPLFPFSVGDYGTGANFAMRRDAVLALGGFDEALGVGTATGGGEDIDVFARVVLSGAALAVEPSALVWHRHRADVAALRTQAVGYGTGLGAWLTKTALRPRTLGMALVRAPGAVRHLLAGAAVPAADVAGGPARSDTVPAAGDSAFDREVAAVRGVELRAVLRGVGRYARSRHTVRARSAAARRTS
ncbi:MULTISPECIES: glycosyltransferase family 2 protein [unclassified Curtobacterium]|uniref:glycosyltransferase family 2 protein n=1 Tax=unclassified Curtobacterium TaxID=257496 RepID=UPI0008376FFF|nr:MULTISPECIES: glycosyltransferase family 2 protein [unclassified Curtobacterium]MBP1299980.1 GT2 family glycosyltransferase [Curtobacterium sp. 1310]MDT0209821.1 glycosyltransferase [Curtobacterium sp. BRD11]